MLQENIQTSKCSVLVAVFQETVRLAPAKWSTFPHFNWRVVPSMLTAVTIR